MAFLRLWLAVVTVLVTSARGQDLAGLAPPLFPLQQDADSCDLFPMAPCGDFHLEEATIDDMQTAMQNGTVTSVQLVSCNLLRMLQVDEYINSILQFNPDALAIAAAMDAERKAGKVPGPLHGIPFTVKDNIATKDSMETTAGSWALVSSIVPRDVFVVSRLRAAGAVLFGKATLSEWADMRSNNYSEGYSGRGGQARNPYNLTLNPGGSSSGSAIGVAANAIAFSLGTETDGSVINPAERNAIVGFKTTVGLTSRAGVIPESEHQDTVGTFGRTVREAVYTLDAIYGGDLLDNYTLAQVGKTPAGGFWVYADDEQRHVLGALLCLLSSAGATNVNGTEILNYETLVSPDGWNWDYGSAWGYANESESLEDIMQYNYDKDGSEGGNPWPLGIPAFYSGQDGFLGSIETKGIKDETYCQALNFSQTSTRVGIDTALTYNGKRLSGLLVPPDVGQTYQIAAQAGYPMITLPAGVYSSTGMPFGLAIMQTAWGDTELVKWASAIEDLQLSSGIPYKRTLPKWYGYLQRNIPVLNL
ncbi:amidase signature domain-containing protein [Coniochaeta sp. 2T2.1]|nr:amidase signature domain-containing protein [Coniochaeta sp. 2T2.1]